MARPGMVHWAYEGNGPFTDEPATTDKSRVTCDSCLRMIEFVESLEADR